MRRKVSKIPVVSSLLRISITLYSSVRASAGSISIKSILSKIAISNIVIPISLYRGQIQKSILSRSNDRIILNPVSKIFSLLAKFYTIFSTTIAPNSYIGTTNTENTKALTLKSELSLLIIL